MMQKEYVESLLCELINSSNEFNRISVIERELKNFEVKYNKISIKRNIKKDYFFTENEDEFGKINIEARINNNSSKTILLNTHFDIVPSSMKMSIAKKRNGRIYGRGACDALGQIVAILATIRKLKENKENKFINLIIQFVNCEETGGNGTLSLFIKKKEKIDYAIVFEPTNLELCGACRGALWFTLEIYGVASHMGRFDEGDNAIYKMKYIVSSLEDYWNRLIKESKNHDYFKNYKFPIQLNLGVINGGLINSSLPEKIILKGAVGFLSNKKISNIKNDLERYIKKGVENYKEKIKIKNFPQKDYKIFFNSLHNDPYDLKFSEKKKRVSIEEVIWRITGKESVMKGFPASCDARIIYLKNKIPTFVFGVGRLIEAHSENEFVNLKDIDKIIKILYSLFRNGK